MQAKGYANWSSATDAYGFSALPAGSYVAVAIGNVGSYAIFWSATEYNNGYAYNWYLHASSADLDSDGKNHGFAVRCVKDSP